MLMVYILTLPFLGVVGINALYSKWWNGTINVPRSRAKLSWSRSGSPLEDAPMKLSEAIRLNGMMKPQGRGPRSIVSVDRPCALGGALQSIGKQPKDQREAYRIIGETWPFIYRPAKCPCGSDHKEIPRKERDKSILIAIVLLNDQHRRTRTQIADWVATVEPEEVQDSSTPSCAMPTSEEHSPDSHGIHKVRWTWTPADLCPICHSMDVRFDWGLDVNKCCNCGAVEVTGGWCAPPTRPDLHCVMTSHKIPSDLVVRP